MPLTPRIALDPRPKENDYSSAPGVPRVWTGCSIRETGRMRPGIIPCAGSEQAIECRQIPRLQWLEEHDQLGCSSHRDGHAKPCLPLARVSEGLGEDQGRPAYPPPFKKTGRCRESFSGADDRFRLEGATIRLSRVGAVNMSKALRFAGGIPGAPISRPADLWFWWVAIQVEVPDRQCYCTRTAQGVRGIDLGVKAAPRSRDEVIQAPRPLEAALRRLKGCRHRLSRKLEAAKVTPGRR